MRWAAIGLSTTRHSKLAATVVSGSIINRTRNPATPGLIGRLVHLWNEPRTADLRWMDESRTTIVQSSMENLKLETNVYFNNIPAYALYIIARVQNSWKDLAQIWCMTF